MAHAMAARVVHSVPELVAAAVAGFCIGPMALVLAGHLTTGWGVALGLVGALVACGLCGLNDVDEARSGIWWTVAALAVAAGWLAYNLRYTAQDVYATRDPATYTITGRWLVDHPSLQIHTMPDVFGGPVGGQIASGSYAAVHGDVLNAQGDHLLPVLLGLAGRVFGVGAVFHLNTVLTALALLVVYGLARRVVGSAFALLAMAVLAVSMPIVYVGRDTYTEPLTMLLLMGALLFAYRGFTRRRVPDWLLAGLLGGTATCVRVDSYGALLGLVAAGTVVAGVAARGDRRRGVISALALLAGAVPPVLLGWFDLTQLSQQYFSSQHGNITHLLAALVAATIAAPFVVLVLWRPKVRARLGSETARRRITAALTTALVVAALVLASRPLWQVTRGPLNPNLENMQHRWHKHVDGTRTYNEQTVHWFALYFGWLTVALAVAGYAVLIASAVRRRRYALVGLLAMGLSMSALYLYNAEISPDQPWAMRRYVPVAIPLMLIASAAALQAVWNRAAGWERARPAVRIAVAAASAVAIAFPLAVTWPMRGVREEYGQWRQLQAICSSVGRDGAVVELDGATVFGYGQSVRSFCDVPAIGLPGASEAQLAAAAAAARSHGRTLYALTQDPELLHLAGVTTAEAAFKVGALAVVNVTRWPTQINEAPSEPDPQQYAVWLARVNGDGTTQELPVVIPGK